MRKLLLTLFLLAASPLYAEELLFHDTVALCTPVTVEIPPEALSEQELERGELCVYLTAHNRQAGWTVHCSPGNLYLTDGETRTALKNPPSGTHLGGIASGTPRKLTFPLPAKARQNGVTLTIAKGVYSMLAKPEGPFTLEVWKGIRPQITVTVDRMNRNYIIDATAIGDDALSFTYETPDGSLSDTPSPTFRRRLGEYREPFPVKVTVRTRDEGEVTRTLTVTPHRNPTPAPRPVEEVLSGTCYYGVRPLNDRFIDEKLGNLFVLWNEETGYAAKEPFLKLLAANGITFLGMYRSGRDDAATLRNIQQVMNGNYLENNIGEYASYLYQPRNVAEMHHMPVDGTDLRIERDRFVNHFINRRVRTEHKLYNYIFSTSGSTLADYELAGGIDFMCSELYAVGAANLNFATAEMRGAARKWRPEYWGGWLAHDWYTQPVSYVSRQKYNLLKVGLYTQYLMGTSVIVLESGATSTQAHQFTAEACGIPQGYDDHAPVEYRRTLRDFYQFIRENPRDKGTPETNIALLRGSCDSWVGCYLDTFPVWAQHKTARQRPEWYYGDPELTWPAAMEVLTPVLNDAVKPYPNYWAGGTPYGQIDVVGVDEESRLADLTRYRFAAFAGWNTMTPELFAVLRAYVEQGGTLLLALPHLSTRTDREYLDYRVSDLIGGGDLSGLIDLRITGFDSAGPVSLATAEVGKEVEILSRLDEKPYVVAQNRGRGRVVLMLGRAYPGNSSHRVAWQKLLTSLAKQIPQSVTVAPVPGKEPDIQAVSFAGYPSRAYFLNTDCVKERTVIATIDGEPQKLTLSPHEFRIVNRSKQHFPGSSGG